MPPKRSNTRNSRPGKRTTVKSTNRLIQKLIDLNIQQEQYPLPSSRDITFPMLKRNRTHPFVFTSDAGLISAGTSGVSGAYTITLSNFPTATLFAGLFDAYMIKSVKILFQNVSTLPSSGSYAPITTAIDYDDSTATVNLSDRDTAMTVPAGKYFERAFVPRVAVALYGGSTFSAFGQMKNEWIDTANPSVPHYGLKYTTGVSSTTLPLWEVSIRAVVLGRNNF
jgi:hypothetical protein